MRGNRCTALLMLGALVLMFSCLDLAAQGKGRIEGTVLDSKNNEPLPGANVLLEGTGYGAATGIYGKFVIPQVPAGNYSLVVSYIGYRKKTVALTVEEGQTLNQEIKLDFQIIEGEVVTVTAQAEGQLGAINQQLTSNTIANIVSQSRIRELPDVNAAESIGRLPGVGISRTGGEATKISIRGLSPKYNTVSINGVRVPSTDGADRSVDLSLISSNILDGIEVKKAITPDMDADVLGGTVDLRLKEAPERFSLSAQAQGGYNKLQDYYGNYNFTGNLSKRFLESRLGVIGGFNLDEYDRSADKFAGAYRQKDLTEIVTQSINLREETVTRGRAGGNLLLDYRIPHGKLTANGIYNRLKWEGLYRINDMNINDFRHNIDFEERGGKTSIFTGGAAVEQNFDWIRYDLGMALTSTRTENLDEKTWRFTREGGSFGAVPESTPPQEIPSYATNDSNRIGIQDLYLYDTNREENQTSLQANVQMPFRLSSKIKGYVKAGGKFGWLDRMNDVEQYGRNGLYYGNNNGPNPVLTQLGDAIPEWDVEGRVRTYGVLGIALFQTDYYRSDFLNGEYPLGFVADMQMLEQMMQALSDSGEFRRYSIGSLQNDYDGEERYQAGYFMAELNLSDMVTLLPGIRYERDHSKYHGNSFRQVTLNNIEGPPADLTALEIERDNDFWLPMVHLQLDPKEWLKVRLAYTQTLTRPDYNQYAPITWMNVFQNYVRAANSLLKPAESTNYDASVSVYQNKIGLFTVSGFYKEIQDLIFQVNQPLHPDINHLLPKGLNLPASWLTRSVQYGADTYLNNPYKARLKGFELEWQTHFWYLPSFFRGVVLNVNYTYIDSEMDKQLLLLVPTRNRKPLPGPPQYYQALADSSRSSRLPDQPAHIANATLGYDLKGFSGRLSFLYQTNRVAFIDTKPELDNFSGTYARWDLTLQQKLGQTGLQFFANFTNLNNRPDENFRGYELANPTYTEYYGFTMDLGVRYRF